MTTTKKTASKLPAPLPAGLTAADLKPPRDYKDRDHSGSDFELWYVDGLHLRGWVIPTLAIGGPRRGTDTRRTYAVTMDGKVCRVGSGPHVKDSVYVYGRKSRAKALAPFRALREKGQALAGSIRDRISSRRAEGQAHRALGHHSWRWGSL